MALRQSINYSKSSDLAAKVAAFTAAGGKVTQGPELKQVPRRPRSEPKAAKRPRQPTTPRRDESKAKKRQRQHAEIMRSYEGRLSAEELAGILSVSTSQVRKLAETYGVEILKKGSRAGPSVEQLAGMRRLSAENSTLRDAAKWLGVRPQTLRRWGDERGITFGRQP